MSVMDPNSPRIDLAKALKGSDQEEFTMLLTVEFKVSNITTLEQVTNAPLRVKATHGADIYRVIKLVTNYYEGSKAETPESKKSS